MIIGGYAVNYYGFHRATDDLDIWIAPTNEPKTCFFNTLKCMKYSEREIELIKDQDFTTYFMCSLGERPHLVDVLTILHDRLHYDEAEKNIVVHKLSDELNINFVPYDFLKDIRLFSTRGKDLFDVARLEEFRNKK